MGREIIKVVRSALALLLLLGLGLSVAMADDADPPGRVARLSLTKGSVSMQPAGDQDWSAATLNRPLTIGDKLWTDQDSRAELDVGSAEIRLGSTTGISFLNLDDQAIQVNVTAGTALVHVRDVGEGQNFEIDTPNIAVTLLAPGDYRIEVNDVGDTTVVKVSNGEAEAAASGQSVPIRTQQAVTFTGTDQVTADAGSLGGPDVLDQWSMEREHRAQQAESSQYVAPDMTGADDLDDYGTWRSDPDYGYVWTPTNVAVGWAPYHYGRWVWVSPWGWTWVDDAPWGFAPFHYGRWAYAGNHWCWVPGPRHIRPVYAPALVAWVGAGVGVAVVGAASVGWLPLGPREVFVPSYRVSNNYVRNVNVSNTTIINNTYITNVYQNKVTNITYANRGAPGAVTAVPRTVFTSAQPVAAHATRIQGGGNAARLPVSARAPDIAPERQSIVGGAPAANVRRPPAALLNRPVVARVTPPPAPAPLDKQLDAIRANGGRPLARAQMTQLQTRTPNPQVRVVGPAAGRPAPALQSGARSPVATDRPGAANAAARPPAPGRPAAVNPPVNRPVAPGRPAAVNPPANRPVAPGRPAAVNPPANADVGRGVSLPDRERALRTTPIPPSESRAAPVQSNTSPPIVTPRALPPQSGPRSDRPPASRQIPEARPVESGRPPAEFRSAEPARTVPEARVAPQAHPVPEVRPVPQARPIPETRAPVESTRPPAELRSSPPPRAMPEERPVELPRPEARSYTPPPPSRPAPEARAVEPQTRAVETPRPAPEARAVAPPPRAAPPPPPRPSPPPQPRPDERRKPPDR